MIGRLPLAVAALLAGSTLALAADRSHVRTDAAYRAPWRYSAVTAEAFPLTRRAAKIRRADRCWRTCLADAGVHFQACLQLHRLTDCVPRNDAADRYCLRECRLGGGPVLPISE